VNTIPEDQTGSRRRRRRHSDEFKADAVAACMPPGVSMAAVAMARGVNANLLRRWVRDAEMKRAADSESKKTTAGPALPRPAFVAMTLPAPASTQGIRIELRRGAMSVSVTWPSNAATECAAWMRELLR
jgi:transposase